MCGLAAAYRAGSRTSAIAEQRTKRQDDKECRDKRTSRRMLRDCPPSYTGTSGGRGLSAFADGADRCGTTWGSRASSVPVEASARVHEKGNDCDVSISRGVRSPEPLCARSQKAERSCGPA